MSAPTAILRFGTTAIATGIKTRHTIHRTLYGLDKGRQSWVSTTANLFAPGAAHPSYSAMRIIDVEEEMEGDEWNYDISFEGLLDPGPGKREAGNPVTTANIEGWDEGSDSWITTDPNLITPGDAMAGYANLYCISATPTPVIQTGAFNIYRLAARYKGLLGTKTYKRSITVNEQIVSPSVPIYVDLPGGWTSPTQKAQMSMPKVVVRDMHATTTAPPTASIPGPLTPPDPPSIQEITFSGLATTRHWPSGWKLASIDGHENIPGTNVHLYTLVYEYVWEYIPT